MMQRTATFRPTLSAILVSPDQALSARFTRACAEPGPFQVLMELKGYPSEQTLDIRLKQLQPEVVIVEVATDFDVALGLIQWIHRTHPDLSVVALDRRSDGENILKLLRCGASEYLYAPFEPSHTAEAVERLSQLGKTDEPAELEAGTVCVFSSVKPGSGASTLATQCAFALQRSTGKRVLLADLDLLGGTVGFHLKLDHSFCALDALRNVQTLTAPSWTSMISTLRGVDVLPAPPIPSEESLDMSRIQTLVDFARTMYDWVICDLPVIFQRASLMTVPQADRTFLVSTSELTSLSMARRSVMMLEQLGFPKARFDLVVNRTSKRDGISKQDMEKLFNCPVHSTLPNDYFSLHRAVTMAQSLGSDSLLGRSIENFAGELAGAAAARRAALANTAR